MNERDFIKVCKIPINKCLQLPGILFWELSPVFCSWFPPLPLFPPTQKVHLVENPKTFCNKFDITGCSELFLGFNCYFPSMQPSAMVQIETWAVYSLWHPGCTTHLCHAAVSAVSVSARLKSTELKQLGNELKNFGFFKYVEFSSSECAQVKFFILHQFL